MPEDNVDPRAVGPVEPGPREPAPDNVTGGQGFEPKDPKVVLDTLYGPWVTSHAGLLQMIGHVQGAPFAPPQTAGYEVTYDANDKPVGFTQREGYFHTAALTWYDFDGKGRFNAYMEHVRGAYAQYQRVAFSGTYELWKSNTTVSGHPIYQGRIYSTLPAFVWRYFFVMKNFDEIEWVWTPSESAIPPAPRPLNENQQDRPLITRGTLTRVRYPSWLGRTLQRLLMG